MSPRRRDYKAEYLRRKEKRERSRMRPIFFQGEDGVRFVMVSDSDEADLAQWIFDLQYRFIEDRASEKDLQTIQGQKVAGKLVESDAAQLEALGDAGLADLDEAYREVLA